MTKKNTSQQEEPSVLVVEMAESSGGLDQLKKFFNTLPQETGMAFIVINHPSAEYKNNITELLQKQISLEVREVNERCEIKPDHIYVIPPNKLLSMDDHHLELSDSEQLKQQRQKESLATLGMYALGETNLESIKHRALQQVCLGLGVDYAMLLSWHPEEKLLKVNHYAGWNPGEGKDREIIADKKWDVGFAVRSEKPVVVPDYEEEERFSLSSFLDHLDIISGINVKIAESDEVSGILCAYSNERRFFSEEDLNFVQIVSHLIGMASERTEAKEALQKTNKQLQKEIERSNMYQKEILHNNIMERWNLGSYLHDDLAQIMVSIKVTLQNVNKKLLDNKAAASKEIEKVTKIIDDGITSIRNLTHEIIPVDIEAEGVSHAFKILMKQLKKTHRIKYTLETDEIIEEIRNKELATNLYHVIQEAVKNAAIHGEANSVKIEVKEDGDNLVLQITDDGVGLSNTQDKEDKDSSSGINIMKHRVELLGGAFNIEEVSNAEKNGTQVTCLLPLKLLKKNKEDQ